MSDAQQPKDDAYEAPKVEQIETEDQPAVTAAGAAGSGTTTTTTVE
jgi:hypothetical protein